MSTHNIGFYEDLTKIIFELSSNIIKYAPYFFCWVDNNVSSDWANGCSGWSESDLGIRAFIVLFCHHVAQINLYESSNKPDNVHQNTILGC